MTALAGANSTIGRAAALVRPTLATPLDPSQPVFDVVVYKA